MSVWNQSTEGVVILWTSFLYIYFLTFKWIVSWKTDTRILKLSPVGSNPYANCFQFSLIIEIIPFRTRRKSFITTFRKSDLICYSNSCHNWDFSINMLCYQYRKYHFCDKMLLWWSCLHNDVFYTDRILFIQLIQLMPMSSAIYTYICMEQTGLLP